MHEACQKKRKRDALIPFPWRGRHARVGGQRRGKSIPTGERGEDDAAMTVHGAHAAGPRRRRRHRERSGERQSRLFCQSPNIRDRVTALRLADDGDIG